jgi:hypothetical protein
MEILIALACAESAEAKCPCGCTRSEACLINRDGLIGSLFLDEKYRQIIQSALLRVKSYYYLLP